MKDWQFYQILMLLWMIVAMVSSSTAGFVVGAVLAVMYAAFAIYHSKENKQ